MKRWEIYLELFMEFVIIIFSLFVLIFVFPKILGFLWPFAAGWIIAMIANPLRNFLEHKIKLSKKSGSALIIIFVLTVIIGGLYLIIAKLSHEAAGLTQEFPRIYEGIKTELLQTFNWINIQLDKLKLSGDLVLKLEELLVSVQSMLGSLFKDVGSNGVRYAGVVAKSVTNGLISTIVMILSAYFFMVEREELIKEYHKKAPKSVKDRLSLIKNNITGAVGGYIKAQIKIMGIIFLILLVGLFIARVDYVFLLAVLICLLDVLPFLGTGTALLPWAVYDLVTGDIRQGVVLIITYLICLLSRQIVQPKIIGDSVGLKPLTTLVLMYIGLKLGGLLGFIFAIVLGIIFLNLYKVGIFNSQIERIRSRIELLKEIK